jgi:GAF domain-containing protein
MTPRSEREYTEPKDELYYRNHFFQIFRNIMKRLSASTELSKSMEIITEDVAKAMGMKGSALMLLDRKEKLLEAVSSYGLSDQYLSKGPVHADKSIRESMDGMPVCVDDVSDDPRIQYPEEAVREGICSVLSAPIQFREKTIGLLRIYTGVQTEFDRDDIEFVQGLADLAGLVIEYNRLLLGYKHSLEAFKKHVKVT